MVTATINYGTTTTLTSTALESNGNDVYWQSAKIDNTELGMWMEVWLKIVTTTTGGDSFGTIDVYLSGSVDGGTEFAGQAAGGEQDYTLGSNVDEKHLRFVAGLSCDASEVSARTFMYHFIVHDLPEDFKIIVANKSGTAISTGNVVKYRINKYDST